MSQQDKTAVYVTSRSPLILKRPSGSRRSGEWNDDDFDVLANGVVVGRIFKANAAPVGVPWMWTLAFGHHEDRIPTHGLLQHARMRWRHLQKAGGGNEVHGKAPPVLRAALREPVGWGNASPRPPYFADFGVRIRTAMRQPALRLAWMEGVGTSHQQHDPAKPPISSRSRPN
jgi:hypothetical protein